MNKRMRGISVMSIAVLLPLIFATGCMMRWHVPDCCCCCPPPGMAQENVNDSLRPVYFDFNDSALTPAAHEQLDKLAAYMNNHPSTRVRVAGNCGTVGSEAYNKRLGERRAVAAKNYLVGHGIAANRIETVSYGRDRPVVKGCKTENCNTPNRRDDFIIIE